MISCGDMNRKMIRFSIFLVISVYSQSLLSQQQVHHDRAATGSPGSFTRVSYKEFFTPVDTVINIPLSLLRKHILPDLKAGTFYDSIKSRASKKFFTRALLDLVIVNPDSLTLKRFTLRSEERYNAFRGIKIRKITIERLNVFGTDVYNPSASYKPAKLEKFLNDTHVNTNEKIIRKNLIFNEGDTISPLKLSDNERILRQLPFIDDARILVVPVSPEEADIVVITRDVYSIGAQYHLKNKSKGTFYFFDDNILGSGHELELQVPYSNKNPESPGLGLTYYLNNIRKSFVNLTFSYFTGLGKTSVGVSAIRTLVSSETKYAGGIIINQVYTDENLDTLPIPAPLHYNYQDYWLLRSFMVNREKVQRIIGGIRFINDNIFERPDIGPDSYYALQKKALLLGSLTFSQQKFFKTNLIYSYGRAEDLPYGGMFRLTGGIERNEFKNRAYLSADGAIGGSVPSLGYFQYSAALGGFLRDGKPEQGVLVSNLLYVSNLYLAGSCRIRNFARVSFTRGFARYTDERIGILHQNGFSGYYNDSLRLGQRMMLSLESAIFTPWNYMGFRFAVFGFTDIAFMAGTSQVISRGVFLSALGVGLRIRNDNLVFNTFQFRIGFFPFAPEYSRENHFLVSGEQLLRPPTFVPGPPATIPYR